VFSLIKEVIYCENDTASLYHTILVGKVNILVLDVVAAESEVFDYVIKTRVGFKECIYSCSIFTVYTIAVAVVEVHYICFP